MALAQRVFSLVLMVGAGLLAAPLATWADSGDTAYSIAGIAVDVSAENAAEAKSQALAAAEIKAFRRLVERLVIESDRAPLDNPPDGVITDLVQSFEIVDERRSGSRYIAVLTYHFKPEAVGRMFRQLGLAYVAAGSPPVVILPLMRTSKGLSLWEDDNPWRDAWASLPSGEGLVPLIMPFGELSDIAIIDASQARAGDRDALAALSEHYGAAQTLVAEVVVIGAPPLAPAEVEVMIHRFDSGGVRVSGGRYSGTPWDTLESVLATAAAESRAQIEREWRDSNILRFDQQQVMALTIPVDGLADWLDLRRRLAGLSLVSTVNVERLSPLAARVVVSYFGDAEQLAGALALDGLILTSGDQGAGDWILRRRGAREDETPEDETSDFETTVIQ